MSSSFPMENFSAIASIPPEIRPRVKASLAFTPCSFSSPALEPAACAPISPNPSAGPMPGTKLRAMPGAVWPIERTVFASSLSVPESPRVASAAASWLSRSRVWPGRLGSTVVRSVFRRCSAPSAAARRFLSSWTVPHSGFPSPFSARASLALSASAWLALASMTLPHRSRL